MIKWLGLIVVLCVLAMVAAVLYQPSLDDIHKDILLNYENVNHVDADEFSTLREDQVVVFDVREESEYEVSHIKNAISVPPDLSANEFMQDYGELLDGKTAVFYCSVGRRSSELVHRLKQSDSTHALVNLKGGVFSWANEKRSLIGNGVHPYNEYWGRLIKDPNMIVYQSTQDKD